MQNWEYKKLGDVCDFIGDGDWIESDDQSPEGIRLVQTGNIGNGIYLNKENKAHYISEDTFKRLKCTEIFPGDCLISRLPEPVGRSCIIPDNEERMITAVDCTILRFNKSIISDYFVYYSQSNKYLADIESESTGATRKRISRKNLTNIEIPLPPLEEQKRIVKILDEKFAMLETVKANAKANLQNAKDLFQSQLTKAFSNTTWEKKRLGEVITYFKKQGKYESLPYIGMEDIESKTGRFLGTEDIKSVQSSTFYFETDDILFGRLRPYLAKVYKAEFNGHCSTEIFPIRTNEKLLPSYLKLWLLSDQTINAINDTCTGARMPRADMNEVLNFEIPLPPLPEQKRIVEQLDSLSEKVRSLEEIYTKQLANCDELKQAFLKKAFDGEL